MKCCAGVWVLTCLPLLGFCTSITLPMPGMIAVRSRSGQFIVYGHPPQPQPAGRVTDPLGTNFVRLEPALVAVSCERIKQALLGELCAPDRWRSKFYVVLHPGVAPNQTIQVSSSRFANGWLYRVDTPAAIEADRFVRTIVRLLLVEWINRFNSGDMIDAPAWLSEGLAELVLDHSALDLLVPPPTPRPFSLRVSTTVRQGWLTNHMVRAHQFLRMHEPLGLDALLAPTQAVLLGEAALTFRYSGQLLVSELIQLPAGRAAMCGFLDSLAFGPDQQSVLLRAFAPYFGGYADMAKWWELKTYHFTSRDLRTQTWPIKDALKKLDDILTVPVLTRSDTNSPAARITTAIQSVIRDNWGQPWLKDTLQFKAAQLQALQLRVPLEIVGLVVEYRKLLQNIAARAPRKQTTTPPSHAAQAFVSQAVAKLNALDVRRAALEQKLSETQGLQTRPPN